MAFATAFLLLVAEKSVIRLCKQAALQNHLLNFG
jgi:hypothetical protein